MKNGIIIRKYEKKDLPSMITIWNEVVQKRTGIFLEGRETR